MFCNTEYEIPKLIEVIFIAGVSNDNIQSLFQSNLSMNLTGDVLLSLPENKTLINPNIIDLIFSGGVSISFNAENPKIYGIVLTNEQGLRSYMYVMKIFEKVEFKGNKNTLPLKKNSIDKDSSKKLKMRLSADSVNSLNSQIGDNFPNIYLPIAICIWTSFPYHDFFRKLLFEIYNIMRFEIQSYNEKLNRNYKYNELIKFFVFINNVLKPPPHSNLTLNLSFSQITLETPSRLEIPSAKDSCIRTLINFLEVSTILKIWIAILCEKQIIFIGNQHQLLFMICEAFLKLIFPLKWINTYIPILPVTQIDYLDAPTPFIMGILSSSFDFDTLVTKYPSHVICDINSSEVNDIALISLPLNEETKLRKKLQILKYPELFDIENLYQNENVFDQNLEDIELNKTFEENVQNVFFRILKNGLVRYRAFINEHNHFDSQSFLEGMFHSEEYHDFWEKIICTQMFEYFVLTDKYLDESNTSIFKNILKLEEGLIVQPEKYGYCMTIPYSINSIYEYLVKRVELNERFLLVNSKFYVEKCKKIIKDYQTVNNEREKIKDAIKKGNNKRNLSEERKKKYKKKDVEMFQNTVGSNKSDKLVRNKIQKSMLNNSLFKYQIHELQNKIENFNFYGPSGFISLFNELFSILNAKEISGLNFNFEIMNELNKLINGINLQENFEKINESIEENESENSQKQGNKSFSYLMKEDLKTKRYMPIIELKKLDCFQYYLTLAFHLDFLTNKTMKTHELFSMAIEKNKGNFPKYRYFQFLEKFDLDSLRHIYSLTNSKTIAKLINAKIQILLKNLENSNSAIFNKIQSDRSSIISDNNYFNQTEPKIVEEKIIILNEHIEKDIVLEERPRKTADRKISIPKNISNKNLNSKNNSICDEIKPYQEEMPESPRKMKRHPTVVEKFNLNSFKANSCESMTKNALLDNIKKNENFDVNEKIVNVTIINSYETQYSVIKDPVSLAEDISVRLFSLITKNALNKFRSEILTKKLYTEIITKQEFTLLKNLVGELKKVELNLVKTNDLCFWINLLNSLILFTVIFKKEMIFSLYEWYRLMRNSNYNIGGYDFSLLEIEFCIIKNDPEFNYIYSETKPVFQNGDPRRKFEIKTNDPLINFAIFYPLKFSPNFNIHFPFNFYENLKLNILEYFSKNIIIDLDKKIVLAPEFLYFFDKDFNINITKYESLYPIDLISDLKMVDSEFSFNYVKNEWVLNFCNIKSFEKDN